MWGWSEEVRNRRRSRLELRTTSFGNASRASGLRREGLKGRVNCPVCRDGFRNYYYRPLKCPHSAQKELHPELSSDDDDDDDEDVDSVENWSEP